MNVKCPHCLSAIDVPETPHGDTVVCLSCGRSVAFSAAETKSYVPELASWRGTAGRPLPASESVGAATTEDQSTTDDRSAAQATGRRDTLEPPGVLGDYELLGKLGSGGMGVVYRARQRTANRTVALKLIRPDRLEDLPPQRRAEWLNRFRTEAQAAARLEHDHIVTVYEVGDLDGVPFYSMRYVAGRSLAEVLRDGPLENRRAAELLERVARAVDYMHGAGILHRDLKPRNILVDVAHRPFVSDFGLAKWLDGGGDGVTQTGQAVGTPEYMSPEQARDAARVTTASDIYSLGATLYVLLTARPPFHAATSVETLRQVLDEEPVSPRALNPAVDRDLETITLKCLDKDPAKRYPSAQAVADDLGRYLRGEPIAARPVGNVERVWRWSRRNPRVAALGGAVAALVLVIAAGSTTAAVVIDRERVNETWQRIAASTRKTPGRRSRKSASERKASPLSMLGWPVRSATHARTPNKWHAALGAEHPNTLAVQSNLGRLLLDLGRVDEAKRTLQESLAVRRRKAPDQWDTFRAMADVGAVFVKQKQYEDAQRLLLDAHAGLETQAAKAAVRVALQFHARAARRAVRIMGQAG
jgi:serine/threonine protein kinase